MKHTIHSFWLMLLGLSLLAGCAIGPHYQRPPVNAPSAFRNETDVTTNSFGDLPWWQVFHDTNLQSLIRIALTNNYDLRIAVTRVEQERAMLIEARSQFFPQINYTAETGQGRYVSGGLPSPPAQSPPTQIPHPKNEHSRVYGGDINASWEIDLWGQIRRLNEAAKAQYFATDEARHDVTTSLVAEVAQSYFQLLELDRQLQIARDSTNSFGQSLIIFNERLKGGVASKLETASAEALMDSAAATIPNLESQIAQQEDQLSVLLGQNPGPIARGEVALEDQDPPEVPAGLPSRLLERRPDIREAEQQLRAANAQVGVAEANFLPQLNLTGLFGDVSSQLSTITSGGGYAAWSMAASLAGPLFHGGQIRGQYLVARYTRDQYVLQYQQAVLNAFQEISDALISREKLAEARTHQADAVEAYKVAVKISMERYRQGDSSYYEVLQEQQDLFPAEDTLAQTQLNQLLAVVQLYRALGGGWQSDH